MVFLVIGSSFVVCIQSLGYIPAFNLPTLSFDAYHEVFAHPALVEGNLLSLKTALISTVVSVIGGVILSGVCIARGKTSALSQTILRIPITIPHALVALFLITMVSQTGLIARIAAQAGLISTPSEFPLMLYTPDGTGIILAYVVKELPFVAFFTLALMRSISNRLGEAAQTLGASPLRAFFSITLPLSLPVILKAAFIIFIYSYASYELPLLLGATTPKAFPLVAYQLYTNPDLTQKPLAYAAFAIILLTALVSCLIYALGSYALTKRLGVGTHE